MFALADPTQVFNFNNSTLDSTVIKVEAQTSYVTNKAASGVTEDKGGTWSDDNTIYTLKDGTLAKGLVKTKDGVYYFNSGIKVTGLVPVESDYYYFEEETGKAVTGLVEVDGKTYYFGIDGKRVAGKAVKYIEDGTTSYYYFDKETAEMVTSKIQKIESDSINGSGLTADGEYCFGSDGKLVESGFGIAIDEEKNVNTYYVDQKTKQITKKSLISSEGSIYYFGEDGKMATGVTSVTLNDKGSQKLDNITYKNGTYYFNTSGEMEKGLINVSVFEDYDHAGIYYFGANGAAVEGLQIIGSNRYYFDETSHKATIGAFKDTGNKISKDKDAEYYFDENGVMVTGFQVINGDTYYYSEKAITLGQKIKNQTLTINGIDYNFDKDGKMVTGFTTDRKYYFDSKGQLVKGWITDNGKTYYASLDTGEIQTGFVKIDGTTYYFSSGVKTTDVGTTKGEMLKGIQTITSGKVKNTYFLGENTGRLVTGWVTADKDGKNYYMNDDGVIQTKWVTIDGSTYYLDPNSETAGAMVTGLQEINGSKYYFGTDGIMRVGFQNVDGTTYYFDEQYSTTEGNRGKLLTGITKINGNIYFLGENTGRVVTGLVTADAKDEQGNRKVFYMNERGIVQTGFVTIDGTTYYFSETGSETLSDGEETITIGQMLKGIQTINGKNYFLGENTGRVVTGWVTADMKDKNENNMIFYMDERGVIQTGFQTIDGTTYYFSQSKNTDITKLTTVSEDNIDSGEIYGQMLKGIQEINKTKYFLGENTGRLITGLITADKTDKNGNRMVFYTDSRGIIQTGFKTINGTTYYFSSKNSKNDSGEEYGQMLKGIQKIDLTGTSKNAITYFLGENTGRLVTGWITADKNGEKYYMNSNGIIQTGLQTIEGNKYYFDKDGVMLKNTVVEVTNKDKSKTRYTIGEDGIITKTTEIKK